MTDSIFEPEVSVVAHGLEGKVIMLYGTNNTGKTYNCAKMKNALFFMCENGLGAQAGVKHKMINNWRMFTKYIKELTDPKTVEKAKAIYSTIVIDEVDEFLSVKNSGRILGFLKEKFPQFNFIATTHSADLIANAEETNLILLYGENFEILDAGDFSSISQVYDIFSVFFEEKEKNDKKKRDDILRRLFNNKMSGIWNSEDEAELREIKEQELTKAQKLIVKQIEEWQV